MKLQLKVTLAVMAGVTVVFLSALYGVLSIRSAMTSYIDVSSRSAHSEAAIAQMSERFRVQVQEWKNTLLRGADDQQRARYWTAFQAEERKVQEVGLSLQDGLSDKDVSDRVRSFLEAHQTMGQRYREAFGLFEASGNDHVAGDKAVQGMDREPVKLLGEAAEMVRQSGVEQITSASNRAQQVIVISLGLMISGALAALVLGMWLARNISRPVQQASIALKAVADGDLSVTVPGAGKDELGDLLNALGQMKASLVSTVSQVRSATDSINVASMEIASGNQDLSARTEQAASNLEETAASMEELTSTVRNSADAARQANQLAASASEVAVRGGQVVGQVVSTMDEINHSSKKIADIIGVIDGIAFQTNILALNAAVEAARAGEQGRGFAVVAGEVRNLAQRSAEAAKEIKGLIGTSVDKVEVGSRLVADAGQTMQEIVGSVQRVSDIIGEITAAAGEQSEGIGQVNTAVNQLDQMTQQNAALVEQSAAAAQSLKDQASRLAEVIRVFRLEGSSAPMPLQPLAVPQVQVVKPAASTTASALARSGAPVKVVTPREPRKVTGATGRSFPGASANKPVGAEGEWESF